MPQETAHVPKREELIEIASRLFYRQGFGATGIKQIIEAAGIAKGTFYTHFRSKEELGVAWLKSRHALWNQWMAEFLADFETPADQIQGLFGFLAKWLQEADYRGCAFINTLAETPDAGSAMRTEVADHKRALRKRIQDLARQHFSGAPAAFADQKGTVIFLLFEGSLIEVQNFQELWPLEAAKAEVTAILASKPSSS